VTGFTARSEQEKRKMLDAIGVGSFEDLLSDIPDGVRLRGDLGLPPPLSELEARSKLKDLAARNASPDDWICFLGGGAYDHFVPSVVDHIASRSEFYTAYTPYQPEISQGTLQSIYEFQSLIARLTGMEIANASLYDGGTALAEAVLMANAINRRKEIVVSGCINPFRLEVLKAYLKVTGFEIKMTDPGQGFTDPLRLKPLVNSNTCCVLMDNPNFFGVVEDGGPVGEIAEANGALLVASVDPISLGLLAAPASYGADIVVGEGQAMGTPLSYGGPYLGFMATRRDFIRKLPGRIVGKTVDAEGRTCFCLTLQTREQHIRREKATSNICTNQALIALRAAIYLTWLGREGMRELAELCLSKAVYAQRALAASGFNLRFDKPFFREFVVDVPGSAAQFVERLAEHKILGGIVLGGLYSDLKSSILLAFTEKRTREDIDNLVRAMTEVR
jgi:glycine dehydrogenase subunit 1